MATLPSPAPSPRQSGNRLSSPEPELEQIEKDCWAMLVQGCSRGKDPLHTFSLATCCREEGVNIRTLVLRRVEKSALSLFSHTDSRSHKCRQLEMDARCSLLFYDAVRRVQIRLQCRAEIHADNAISAEMWQETRLSSRKGYLSNRGPGEPLSQPGDGLPGHLVGRDPSPEESEGGRKYFSVLQFRVLSMDWLFLSSQGNRRARFEYTENGFDATWVNP